MQVGSDEGGRSQEEEMVMGGLDVIKVEAVSVSSGEPSDLDRVTQLSCTEGPTTLMWVGDDPF
jgi:hypothetical protein